MAEFKEVTYSLSDNLSRYKKNKVYLTEKELHFSLPDIISLPEREDDSYFEVVPKYKDRLDLVANKFYNNSKLWWILAFANNLDNACELPIGKILRIPNIGSLYGQGGLLE